MRKIGFIRYYHNDEQQSYCLKHCMGQSHAFRKHSHDEYSIALVTGGESLFRFVNDEFIIQRGQLVIIGPNIAHQCSPKSISEWSFYMLHVSSLWIQETGFDIDELANFAISDLLTEEYNRIEHCFKRACMNKEDAVENIILIIESAFSQQLTIEIEHSCSDTDEPILASVYEHIGEHYKEMIPLEELVKKSGMDRYTLIRKFNKRYNTTPHSWQIMLRVNEARNMLEKGCSISEAALEVGFYDQSHFSKVFKETYGVTPKHFVKSF